MEVAKTERTDVLRDAEAALRSGDLDTAFSLYETVEKTSPGHLAARLGMARVLLRLSQTDDAERILQGILGERPTHKGALLLYGNAALQRKDAETALNRFHAVLSAHPGNVSAQRSIIKLLMRLGREQDVIAFMSDAQHRETDDLVSLLRLAQACDACKDTRRRNETIGRILAKEPASLDPAQAASQISAAVQDLRLQPALELSKSAAERFPKDARISSRRLQCLILSQDQEAAETFHADSRAELGVNDGMDVMWARALENWGRTDEAIAVLTAVRERNQGSVAALMALYEIYSVAEGFAADLLDVLETLWAIKDRADASHKPVDVPLHVFLADDGQRSHVRNLLRAGEKDLVVALFHGQRWIQTDDAEPDDEDRAGVADTWSTTKDQPRNDAVEPQVTAASISRAPTSELVTGLLETLSGSDNWRFTIPYRAVNRAWRNADQSAYNFDDWLHRATWAVSVQNLMKLAFIEDPRNFEYVSDRFETVGVASLRELSEAGQPFLSVTSHAGYPAALIKVLIECPSIYQLRRSVLDHKGARLPFRAIKNWGSGPKNVRAMLSVLRAGGSLMASNDQVPIQLFGQKPALLCKASFLGRKRAFGSLIPRLAFRERLPIYWVQATYQDGRFVIKVEPMSELTEEMDEMTWLSTWTADYADRVEAMMIGAPERFNPLLASWN